MSHARRGQHGGHGVLTWAQRCETHPDHDGVVTEDMIRARMQEEIDALRAALAAAPQQKRADALAETINALRAIVTDTFESKEQFIARVRAILSACPDTRVLQAVLDEREACAMVCIEQASTLYTDPRDVYVAHECAAAIRARGQPLISPENAS
jgi:hypothetical protein